MIHPASYLLQRWAAQRVTRAVSRMRPTLPWRMYDITLREGASMFVFVALGLFTLWEGYRIGNTLSAKVTDAFPAAFLALLLVWTFFLTLFVAYQRPRVTSRGGRR